MSFIHCCAQQRPYLIIPTKEEKEESTMDREVIGIYKVDRG